MTHSERGYEIRAAMGIAERETEADNAAFTNMAAVVVLRDAIHAAEKLGRPPILNGLESRKVSFFQRKVALSSLTTASSPMRRRGELLIP